MLEFYELNIIPDLLKNFKVEKVIISGLKDKNLVNEILNYDASFIAIDAVETHPELDTIKGYPLNILPYHGNYGAIVINDDPNWYTIYNELNIIKKTNDEFPLVFICNNRFPYKYRDAYSDPESIPDEFRQEYIKELPISYDNKRIVIDDEYYHACAENTKKNGVSTAINDFLNENKDIGIMDIAFIEEITILYPKSTISTIRIDNVKREDEDKKINYEGLSDRLMENQILFSYIKNHADSTNESVDEIKLNEYKNKIKLQESQIKYKNSQITNAKSELDVKDLQVRNIESKLVNKDYAIKDLETQLQTANDKIDYLETEKADLNFKIKINNEKMDLLKEDLLKKEKLLDRNTYKSSQITTKEYCINCLKEEISNNKVTINYLKKESMIKRLLTPLSYLYLLIKSKPEEFSINLKLYKALKNSECFDIGYYLNKNKDIQKGKWVKYFSPELHYVCNGFDENRVFNKKYFNRNSKKELLNYLLTCERNK